MLLRRLVREPLVHFVLIGVALFVLYGLVGDDAEYEPAPLEHIEVTSADIQRLTALFTRTWQRPPTRPELERMVEEYIDEEVL